VSWFDIQVRDFLARPRDFGIKVRDFDIKVWSFLAKVRHFLARVWGSGVTVRCFFGLGRRGGKRGVVFRHSSEEVFRKSYDKGDHVCLGAGTRHMFYGACFF
jgi:hypothetical protein